MDIKNKIFLAPMAGYTDEAFRTIAFREGVDFAFTEMVSAKALMYKDKKTLDMLKIGREEKFTGVQLFGSDEKILGEATKFVESLGGVSMINLNLGCPAPKIFNNGEGSALLGDADKVYSLVHSMRRNTEKLLSAKIRLGIDEPTMYKEVSKAVEDAGADFLIVHGRTREQFYSGFADWGKISEIKLNLNIPVIGNGDINTAEDAREKIEKYGVDGVMIGRGALGSPWIFREIKCGEKISDEEKFSIICEHLDLICDLKGEYAGVREMRKHLHSYFKGMRNSSKMKNLINSIEDKKELEEAILNYKNELNKLL